MAHHKSNEVISEAGPICERQDRPDGNPIDWMRARVRVIGELDQAGRWKEYPKTAKSRREVPVPRYLLEQMSALIGGRGREARVFISPRARADVSGANWRLIWYQAIDGVNAAAKRQGLDPIPRLTPHDCRHTAASWLVQAGVPLYDVQALLGHESSKTTERYSHLRPGAHARVEDAWSTILAHQQRTKPPKGRENRA